MAELKSLGHVTKISHRHFKYSILDNRGRLYLLGEPALRDEHSLTEANLVAELSSLWIEDAAMGDNNLALVCAYRNSPMADVFSRFGKSALSIKESTNCYRDINKLIYHEKIKGVDKMLGLSKRMSGRRNSQQKSRRSSVMSDAESVHSRQRKSSFFVNNDANREKLQTLFSERLSSLATKNDEVFKSPEKSTISRNPKSRRDSKFRSFQRGDTKNWNLSIVSESGNLAGKPPDSRCPPVSKINNEKSIFFDHQAALADVGISERGIRSLVKHNVKLPSLDTFRYDTKLGFHSHRENDGVLKEGLEAWGVSEKRFKVMHQEGQNNARLEKSTPNPFAREYGNDYYKSVSKMVLGAPDSEYYRMVDKREVSDFFKQNVSKPREMFMSLIEDGKLKELMDSVLLHALDPLGNNQNRSKSSGLTYKIHDDDDVVRDHVKDEVAKSKVIVSKLQESCIETSEQLDTVINAIIKSKQHCANVIHSVEFKLNPESFWENKQRKT